MGTTKATKTPKTAKTPKSIKVTRTKVTVAQINGIIAAIDPVVTATLGTELEPTIEALGKKLLAARARAAKRSDAVVKNAEKKLAAIKKQVDALRAAGVEVNL